jgi:hypothetical protein
LGYPGENGLLSCFLLKISIFLLRIIKLFTVQEAFSFFSWLPLALLSGAFCIVKIG